MHPSNEVVTQVVIRLNGSTLPTPIAQELQEVVVDQHNHLPDFFSIRLHDPTLTLLDKGPFDLAKEVEVDAVTRDGEKIALIKRGEITALEPCFNEGKTSQLIVQGFDKSHRLFRQPHNKAHLNKKDSDLAEEIARSAGLKAKVDATPIVYEHIFQHNQPDLIFLMRRASRIGYECYVDDDTLYFCKPPSGTAFPTLKWGDDLLSFHPRMSLSEQVDEVSVKGWDVATQNIIIGRSQKGNSYPKIGESQNGAAWAKNFGAGQLVIVDQPVINQAEADTLAAARLDAISAAFVEADGEAYRRPEIKAGRMIKLEKLGKRFSGTYLVTRAIHRYCPGKGFTTVFTVKGARTGLLTEQINQSLLEDRWPGVVIGIITNTDDPKNWGRVKVKFPWLSQDTESNWARVLDLGAGPNAGICIIPAIGDEVLVAFEHADFSQPFVLGGVWNGKLTPPPQITGSASGEKALVRTWQSRSGHSITMSETSKNKRIEIKTAGGNRLVLDDTNHLIQLSTPKGQMISMKDGGNINIDAGSGTVNIKSNGKIISLNDGGNINIDAGSGQVNINASKINLNPPSPIISPDPSIGAA